MCTTRAFRLAILMALVGTPFCAAWASGTISGTVTKNSAALPSAYIDVMDSGSGFQEVQSGPDGAYAVTNVAAGNADVYCYAPDNKLIEHRVVNVPEGGTATASFDWSVGRVWGVVKKNGQPLQNAHIVLNDRNTNWYNAYTNALGNYSIEDVTAGSVGVYAYDSGGLQIGYRAATVYRDSDTQVSFTSWETGSVQVTVLRAGQPAMGQQVDIHDAAGNWHQGLTGPTGQVTLGDIAVGTADVWAYAPGNKLIGQQQTAVQQGQTSQVQFDWQDGDLEVTVLKNGVAYPGCMVSVLEGYSEMTDENGQAILTLPSGDYQVSAQNPQGYPIGTQTATVTAGGTTSVTFDWAAGEVAGTITKNGWPLPGAYAACGGAEAIADEAGAYSLDLPPGEHQAVFHEPLGSQIGAATITIVQNETTPLDFNWRVCTPVGGTYSTNTTWSYANSPYLVTTDVVVSSGTTLTIEPGVVVKFRPVTQLNVAGMLHAVGYPGNLIVFTSEKDDSAGGDTNGDGNATLPAPGDWQQLAITGGADMDYCRVSYAGGGGAPGAINLASGSLAIQNSTISSNGSCGVYHTAGSPTIAGNTINNNGGYPISLAPAAWTLGPNSASGNTPADEIEIRAGYLAQSASWGPANLPYRVTGTVQVGGGGSAATAAVLTLQPGTELRFASGAYLVLGFWSWGAYYGALSAVGTAEQPIRLVALSGSPGGWYGILFNYYVDSSRCFLDHCLIENAGGSGATAAVNTGSNSPSLTNCTLVGSASHGIYLTGGSAAIKNCVVANCTGAGVESTAAGPTLTYSDVWNNAGGNVVGITPGEGCISDNPMFANPANHDYNLQPGSPCIDSGDPTMSDPDGSRIDMGAHVTGLLPPGTVTLGQVRNMGDGNFVTCRGQIVTAVFSGYFYVEDPNRAAGIRVSSSYVPSLGDSLQIAGWTGTVGGERYVLATGVTLISSGNPVPKPLTIVGKQLGGESASSYTPGVESGLGLNNIGLLVTVVGWVTHRGSDNFTIDDGSGLYDQWGNPGIEVLCGSLSRPPYGSYVIVTGISTCQVSGEIVYRVVRVRQQSDIRAVD